MTEYHFSMEVRTQEMVYRKPNYSISDWNTNFQRKCKAIVTLTVIHCKHFFQ